MPKDAQGYELSGATAEAANAFDQGVRAFILSYGDTLGTFENARQAAPGAPMMHLAKAWVLALANDAVLVKGAGPLIETARQLQMNDRERTHLAALEHAVKGHRASVTAVLDRHLMSYPLDLLGHFAAMLADAFQGRFANVRDRSARALPCWSRETPGYGIMLSLYGFGLEEAGHYEKSEAISREAAELEPYGYWPHHAVSHVMEMTGRPAEGLKWMQEREAFWSGKANASRTHIWWHKALFHVELGDYDKALQIYDGPIVETQRPAGISLTNASALLWRLETLGIPGGARWKELQKLWSGHADGKLCLFADIHAAIAAIRAEDGTELERLVSTMRHTASDDPEVGGTYRDIGIPLVEGFAAYARGAYGETVDKLLGARRHLWRIGGSHAQRDLVDWTLTEAARRAGIRDVALALANERIALRPESAPNKRFLTEAQQLPA
ncbi:MAG: tetratricopeptide repeat protein [Proteobacteria bacterium]|nr:tetratricopeptide repeat protein [Pseudomonadota bacterium]